MSDSIQELSSQLRTWFIEKGRPFFVEFSDHRVPQLDSDFERLQRLEEARHPELNICFLGHSGVGKSTLINALVDPNVSLLPQGGVGPLTAQAIEVRYSRERYFRVSYLGPRNLNRVLFALRRLNERATRPTDQQLSNSESEPDLAEDDRSEIELALPLDSGPGDPSSAATGSSDAIKGYVRQARLLVRGDQFGEVDLPYLIRALELALKPELPRRPELCDGDAERIGQLREALAKARSGEKYEFRFSQGKKAFFSAVQRNAAGHLAPMIKALDIGWPCPVLESGLVLVDLPGVGVVNDEYRKTTTSFIRKAKAVVLVVDRAGVTEDSAELLRSVGFLTGLLHEESDSVSPATRLIIAVVKLDLSATDARTDEKEIGETPRPWLAHFQEACSKAVDLIRSQLRDELSKIVEQGPSSTIDNRRRVMDRVLNELEVYPVSALEYQKYHAADEEEHPRIKTPEQSGVPQFGKSLKTVAEDFIGGATARLREHVDVLANRLATSMDLIAKTWDADREISRQAAELRAELDKKIAPLQAELQRRRSSFRVFLRETVPEKVQTAVSDASLQAQKAISRYLRKFADYHWATLRAAVRRGGTFLGAKHVEIPNEVTLLFEEEITVLWASRILPQIRKRTQELGGDYVQIQGEILEWAKNGGGRRIDLRALEQAHLELKSITAQFGEVGKDAVKETRERVKVELFEALEEAVGRKCRKFVEQKLDIGTGTKARILDMLRDELPEAVVEVARKTADKVLTANARMAEGEIVEALKKIPDPIESAKSQIVSSAAEMTKHQDQQRREQFQTRFAEVRGSLPEPAYVH